MWLHHLDSKAEAIQEERRVLAKLPPRGVVRDGATILVVEIYDYPGEGQQLANEIAS